MKGGKLLNNWRMAEIHAKEAPERVLELERWGAVFDRNHEGSIHQRSFGGHTYPRLAHIGDRTGLELIRSLQDHLVHQPGVTVHMETTCTRLLVQDGRVQGALGYRRHDGALVVYRARAVLLASGGLGKIYRVTSNSWESTGDGSAMALNAGALLMDCEMVQFHPTGMVWPPGVRGILVTEGVRGEGGLLFNNKHERFMEKYDPERMELSTRDVVARSINQEVIEGRGSPHGGAFLDISHRPRDYILNKLPSMYEQFHSAGGHRHHQRADGGGPHHPLLDGRGAGRAGERRNQHRRPVRGRRGRLRTPRCQPAGRQLALRSDRVRQASR